MEKTMEKRRIATRNMILCALFASLIAIGAFIKIPIPYVPITFQGFFVLLAGFLLGPKYGCISMLIYIAVGLVGFPVFTAGGGIMYVLQPTFGYLAGFAVCAYVAGARARRLERPGVGSLFLSGMLGMVPVYIIGTLYFYFIITKKNEKMILTLIKIHMLLKSILTFSINQMSISKRDNSLMMIKQTTIICNCISW